MMDSELTRQMNRLSKRKIIDHFSNTAEKHNSNLGAVVFSFLSDTELTEWIVGSKRVRYEPGDRLLRPDEFFAGIS